MESEPVLVSETIWASGGKRGFDAVLSAALILVVSPILLVSILLIVCTSRGPVFFRQARGGRGGRTITICKLRTMRANRKPDAKELVPLDHPEITAVGWFLRRFKIDELPQLFSVLAGDMSLIGPRPTLPEQVAAYDAFRKQRLLIRPGITGLAQVNGNASVSWDERILYDIAYVRRCGFLLDMQILLRTVLVLLFGERRMTRPFAQSPYVSVVEVPEGYSVDSGSGS